MDLVSIIVPVYMVEAYLKKCVDSLRSQTYTNIEIILVDDGSKDNCGVICDEYAKMDSRIKAYHKENGGMSDARNYGIEVSNGKYITFLDSDDYVEADFIETLYTNIIKQDADVACVNYNVVREDGSIIEEANPRNGLDENETVIYEKDEIIKEILLQKTLKNFSGLKMVKKEIIPKFTVGVCYEDIMFSCILLSRAKKVVYINKRCYYYLKRKGSMSSILSEKNLYDFGTAIKERYDFIVENYENLKNYAIYATIDSTVALSIKNVLSYEGGYESVNTIVNELFDYINTFSKENEDEIIPLLNDYQKLCIYLMRYNKTLYFSFLKERHKMKMAGLIK